MRVAAVIALFLTLLMQPTATSAHALEPGFLELRALGGDVWRVFWRVPQAGAGPLPLVAVLPEDCDLRRSPELVFDGRAFSAGWIATCLGGIEGGEIAIEGLGQTQTDVLIRYETAPGTADVARLTASTPGFVIPTPRGFVGVLSTYIVLGIEHILGGFDHLMFVFALILLIPDRRRLIGAVTAFTVAHSFTLAAAVLGWIVLPSTPVEVVIALSIMFLASELLKPPAQDLRLSERYPWIVAFVFGLLHGLGFASALLEVGLPQGDVPLALFAFNIGVEMGQLLFVAVVLSIAAVLRRVVPVLHASLVTRGKRGHGMMSYIIGVSAATWFITRIAAF